EDGIRDFHVTGVQTCALPIFPKDAEWASAICGLTPKQIRYLARTIGSTPKVSLLTAWAPARVNDSDSWPHMFMTLGAMTGHIGRSEERRVGKECRPRGRAWDA